MPYETVSPATSPNPYYAEPSLTFEVDPTLGDPENGPANDTAAVDASDHQAAYGFAAADQPPADSTPSAAADGVNNLDPAFNAYAVGGVEKLL